MPKTNVKDLNALITKEIDTEDVVYANRVQYKNGKQIASKKPRVFYASDFVLDATDLSKQLNYSRVAIHRWVKAGHLKAYKVTYSTARRFKRGEMLFRFVDVIEFFAITLAPGVMKLAADGFQKYPDLFYKLTQQQPSKEVKHGRKKKPDGG
jgi:hypothetical protein